MTRPTTIALTLVGCAAVLYTLRIPAASRSHVVTAQSRAAAQIRLEMRERDQFVAPLRQSRSAQAVEPTVKHEVFMHGQLVVERKFLGHVADERLDAVGFARHVVAGDLRAAIARFEEAAQHADDRGFA